MSSPIKLCPYSSFLNYSSKGKTDAAKRSFDYGDAVKDGRPSAIKYSIDQLIEKFSKEFDPFLNSDTTLVPVPRRYPFKTKDSQWPSLLICQELVKRKLGKEIVQALERHATIPASHFITKADDRPPVKAHLDSIRPIIKLGLDGKKITMVDDFITIGRTSAACAMIMANAYPNAELSMFSIFRSQLPKDANFDRFEDPEFGNLYFNPGTGKGYTRFKKLLG